MKKLFEIYDIKYIEWASEIENNDYRCKLYIKGLNKDFLRYSCYWSEFNGIYNDMVMVKNIYKF